ncbi:hypothetical protein D6789_03995 [Candidatus Woesearchaeota archaeon]|nr:MAG: hypothetical protein D6789_03995 [Candidatus Woesearchaeota archaeon]
MTSITKQVWRLIDEDPSARRDLSRGIINVSGFAAYIKKQYAIQGSLDSIISAIRRYHTDKGVQEEYNRVRKALRDAVVSTKTRITALHLKNSVNLYKYLSELMRDAEFYKSEIFRLLKSRNETVIMIDEESLRRAKSFFPEGNIVSVDPGLALLNLSLTAEGWNSKGVLARIANELANYNVNIIFIFSVEPNVSIFLKEADLPTAHEAVLSLTQ